MIGPKMDRIRKWGRFCALATLAGCYLAFMGCERPTATSTQESSPTPANTWAKAILRADPNPVPAGTGVGTTIISWDTGNAAEADVYLVSGDKEIIFGRGAKISQPAAWIQPGSTEFRMYSRPEHKLVAELTVTRPQLAVSSTPAP